MIGAGFEQRGPSQHSPRAWPNEAERIHHSRFSYMASFQFGVFWLARAYAATDELPCTWNALEWQLFAHHQDCFGARCTEEQLLRNFISERFLARIQIRK